MRIQSKLDRQSEQFQQNEAYHRGLLSDLQQRVKEAQEGCGEKNREALLKQGKCAVRNRIHALIDPGSEFLELLTLAGHEHYECSVASGGYRHRCRD
jgi:3-methylcrotonyl-CoA carboxylase beta subunit